MGGQESKQISSQIQVVDQNFSNEIMLLVFSTLETICLKIMGKECRREEKKFGRKDVEKYSKKTMAELVSQFKTNLYLFQISKQQMEADFKNSGGFMFPKNFSKEDVLNEISIFTKICKQEKDINQQGLLLAFCQDFRKLVNGDKGPYSFESIDVKVNYTQKEKEKNKKMVLKNGIEASHMMDQAQKQVEDAKVANPSQLEAKFNKPAVDYKSVTAFQ